MRAAGTSSFGMSGVNAHALFGAPRVLTGMRESLVGCVGIPKTAQDPDHGTFSHCCHSFVTDCCSFMAR